MLTDERKADILLMDEAKGRAISGKIGISIMGTFGLLISAYEDNLITSEEARKCIDDLQKSGRHIAPLQDIIRQIAVVVMLLPFGNVLVMKTRRTIWTVLILMEIRHRNDCKTQVIVQKNDNVS